MQFIIIISSDICLILSCVNRSGIYLYSSVFNMESGQQQIAASLLHSNHSIVNKFVMHLFCSHLQRSPTIQRCVRWRRRSFSNTSCCRRRERPEGAPPQPRPLRYRPRAYWRGPRLSLPAPPWHQPPSAPYRKLRPARRTRNLCTAAPPRARTKRRGNMNLSSTSILIEILVDKIF